MKTDGRIIRLVAAAVFAASALGGCWLDDDDDDVVGGGDNVNVPADAGASVASFVAFLGGLSTTDETSLPLQGVGAFVAPTDETGGPVDL